MPAQPGTQVYQNIEYVKIISKNLTRIPDYGGGGDIGVVG